jgi:hypothetical protein
LAGAEREAYSHPSDFWKTIRIEREREREKKRKLPNTDTNNFN